MDSGVFRDGGVLLAQSSDNPRSPLSIMVLPEVVFRGGTAAIYKGRIVTPVSAGGEVALKVIKKTPENSDACEQTVRELRTMSRVQHQFIIPFLGTAEPDNALVIVTPFMANGNLLAFLAEHPSAVRPLLVQVAAAIKYLHTEAGFVHGDLKCENVLVSDDGTALLSDFGLSALVEKADADETTRTGFRSWNTLPFAAPELLLDEAVSDSERLRSKTPASDVYAFGMLMLQAFTGKHPWEGCSRPRIVLNVAHIATRIPHPRPVLSGHSGLTDLWWEVRAACCVFSPNHRPSMEDVHAILEASLSANAAGELALLGSLRAGLPAHQPVSLGGLMMQIKQSK